MTSDPVAASKFLSYVLRHQPSAIGVELDGSGWVPIDALLAAAAQHGRFISPELLREILDAPGKRRFEVRGSLIRAAYGQSVPVDLGLVPSQPPPMLYHGTVARFLSDIRAEGLKPGKRVHVHLSADPATAAEVARRRGTPVILVIDAAGAYQHGQLFFRAGNGIWLTGHLPPRWISAPPGSPGRAPLPPPPRSRGRGRRQGLPR
jgi:putative RNA 2'-phosphotransferase